MLNRPVAAHRIEPQGVQAFGRECDGKASDPSGQPRERVTELAGGSGTGIAGR